jgi:hypothetical protein
MRSIICAAILLSACQTTLAQCCCDHCGCQAACQKVCRVVCETKQVPKITYDCECEDFCVPGPSQCATVCDECGHKHNVYTPTCGRLRTRTKMIKHETFEEKVVYKWVVENVCCSCAQNAGARTTDARGVAAKGASQAGDVERTAFHAPVVKGAPPAATAGSSPAERASKFDLRRLFAPLAARP